MECYNYVTLADLDGEGGGYGGCNPPPFFKFQKIKESIKAQQ